MDLGYHFDLTDLVLKRRGFSGDAILVAKVSNALTDLIGNFLSSLPSKWIDDANIQSVKKAYTELLASRVLHADNLFSPGDAERYLKQLFHNALHEAKSLNDVYSSGTAEKKKETCTKFLVMIGMVTHAIHDFHSHSTWVHSLNTRDGNDRISEYKATTPFSAPDKLEKVVTGWYEYTSRWEGWYSVEEAAEVAELRFHDGFVSGDVKKSLEANAVPDVKVKDIVEKLKNKPNAGVGLHLDSQEHKIQGDSNATVASWDETYVTAYLSCEDFLANIAAAAPGLIKDCSGYDLQPPIRKELVELVHLLTFAFMWLQVRSDDGRLKHDGHWKGTGSGDMNSLLANVLWVPLATVLALILDRSPKHILLLVAYVVDKAVKLESIWQTFSGYLGDTSLTKDLYKTIMGNNLSVPNQIEQEARKTKCISLRITFANNAEPVFRYEPFIRVFIQEYGKDDALLRRMHYHERSFRELVLFDNKRVLWEVLHLSHPDCVRCVLEIRLFDEDTLFSGSDDEIKISHKSSSQYGASFEITLDPPKLSNPKGCNIKDEKVVEMIGETDAEFFRPLVESLNCEVHVSSIKP